jgi:hypothetical protein
MQGDIDINKQFFTTANSKFVLHDGGGFESDDSNNVSTVKDFIARRLEMPDLEDKLHAIWYDFWLSLWLLAGNLSFKALRPDTSYQGMLS